MFVRVKFLQPFFANRQYDFLPSSRIKSLMLWRIGGFCRTVFKENITFCNYIGKFNYVEVFFSGLTQDFTLNSTEFFKQIKNTKKYYVDDVKPGNMTPKCLQKQKIQKHFYQNWLSETEVITSSFITFGEYVNSQEHDDYISIC